MQKDNTEEKANEPQPDYNNRIVFFNSFDEMNEYDLQEMASHSPIQRLQNITQMIMEMYKDELKTESNNLVIQFK